MRPGLLLPAQHPLLGPPAGHEADGSVLGGTLGHHHTLLTADLARRLLGDGALQTLVQ